jgi:hypothetical protein
LPITSEGSVGGVTAMIYSKLQSEIWEALSIKVDMEPSSDSFINIKSTKDLSEDISISSDTGETIRLEFLLQLPEMQAWHKFRLCNVPSAEADRVLEEIQKMPYVEEAYVDKPRLRAKR